MTSCLINKNTKNAYTNKTTTLPRVVELIKKIKEQREKIVQQYNIVPGKPIESAPAQTEDMSRA